MSITLGKLKKVVFYFGAVLTLGIAFQNCSATSFEGVSDKDLASTSQGNCGSKCPGASEDSGAAAVGNVDVDGSGGAGGVGSIPVSGGGQEYLLDINIEQNVTYLPYKILMIIDNSYTMTKTQQKLSQVISSLVTSFAGKDLEIKVITTTDFAGYFNNSVVYDYKSTTYVDDFFSSNTGSPLSAEFVRAQPDNFYYSMKRTFGTNSGTIYKFSSSSSSAIINATIAQMKQKIALIGTGGSDQEQAFCPFAREFLSKIQKDNFFNSGDRAGVIVVSDEDDSSNPKRCLSGYKGNFLQRTSDRASIKAQSLNLKVSFKYEYDSSRDGIIYKSSGTGSLNIEIPKSEYELNQLNGGICSEALKTKLQKNYESTIENAVKNSVFKVYPNYKYSEIQYAGCGMQELWWKYSVEPVALDLPAGTKICEVANYKGSGLSVGKYLEKNNIYGYYLSCSEVSVKDISLVGGVYQEEYNFLGATSTNEFMEQVLLKAQSFFVKDQFFMSFIVNKASDISCSLEAGQVFGTNYENLAKKYPLIAKTYSICESDFTNSLKKISESMISSSQDTYSVGGIAVNKIIDVTLVRGTTRSKLDPSEYDLSTPQKITIKINLKEGDKIVIRYIK